MSKRKITDFFTVRSSATDDIIEQDESCDGLMRTEDVAQTDENEIAGTSSTRHVEEEPAVEKKRKKEPKFQDKWLSTYNWLRKEPKGGMSCVLCRECKKDNPFTAESGCKNYRTSTLTRHMESADHAQALRESVMQKEFQSAAVNAVSKMAEKKDAIICAMRTAYYIAYESLPIAKYSSLIELQKLNGCEALQSLRSGDNAHCVSRSTGEKFIDTFADLITADLDKKMQSSEFIRVMIDESTDISVSKKLVVYANVVSDDLNVQTLFLGNLHVKEVHVTADVLFTELENFLKKRGVSFNKIVGFGSDGASIMTGKKTGVATRYKEKNPHLVSVHCMAHRLNLCSSKAAEEVAFLNETFQNVLKEIFRYFKKSSSRTAELKQIQNVLDSDEYSMKEVHEIRWMAFYSALYAVYHSWKPLVCYFEKHKKDSKTCAYMYENLTHYKFVAMLYFLMDIIPSLASVSMTFQKQQLDVSAVKPVLDGFYTAAQRAKEGKSHHQTLFLNELKMDGAGKCASIKGVKLGRKGETEKDQKEVSKEINQAKKDFCDKLVDQMKRRFPAEHTTIATSFAALGLKNLSFLSKEEVADHGLTEMETLIQHLGEDKKIGSVTSKALIDGAATLAEYSLAKNVILQQKYPRDNMIELWKIMFEYHVDQFPNLFKLAKLAAVLPLQRADCERGFSLQNRIHTALRNRLTSETVNKLMTIQIQGGHINDFQFPKALKKWSDKKQRRIFTSSAK